jgi:mRNA interferase MazF
MIRGEIWIVAGGSNYAGKPRPNLIVQSQRFMDTASVTVCPFTSDPSVVDFIRPTFDPTPESGLRLPCRLMVDKMTTVPKSKLGQRIGAVSLGDMARVNDALMLFLGLAG